MADSTPAPAKDGRVFDTGAVQAIDGTDHEVTAVSYQEDAQGNRHSFTYAFRNKAELDNERQAIAKAEAELAKQQEQQPAAATDSAGAASTDTTKA